MQKMLKFMLLIILALNFFIVQGQEILTWRYSSKKSVLDYSFISRNDSLFIIGELKEKSTKEPILSMNVSLQGTLLGTVPNLNGSFELFLPFVKGTIVFNKIGSEKFTIDYDNSARLLDNNRPGSKGSPNSIQRLPRDN